MININLIKNQIPTQIDLPKKKRNYKKISVFVILGILFAIGLYFVFVYEISRVSIIGKNVVPKTKLYKSAVKKSKEIERNIAEKPKKIKKAVVKLPNKTIKSNKKEEEAQKAVMLKNRETVKKIEKHNFPVFSLSIELENIPKPIPQTDVKKDKNSLYEKLINSSSKENVKKESEKPKNIHKKLYVEIKTRRYTRIKHDLNSLKIRYKYKKIAYKQIMKYTIFVGGLDSYPKVIKFAKALKKKGYSIYKIVNMDLLFYVCIDKNIGEKKRNRYIDIWGKTPFRVVAIQHTEPLYLYKFVFQCSKKTINILKKKGYYPIILSHQKSGA